MDGRNVLALQSFLWLSSFLFCSWRKTGRAGGCGLLGAVFDTDCPGRLELKSPRPGLLSLSFPSTLFVGGEGRGLLDGKCIVNGTKRCEIQYYLGRVIRP